MHKQKKKHKKTIFKNCPHFILKKAQKIYLTCIVFYLEKIKQTRPKTVHMGRNRDKKISDRKLSTPFYQEKMHKKYTKKHSMRATTKQKSKRRF